MTRKEWRFSKAQCLNDKTCKRGFTLFEVLVSVGILALLVAALMPTLHSAKERAKRIQCVGNERQILIAMMQYSADYNGYLPTQAQSTYPYTDWSARLTNYLSWDWRQANPNERCVFTCPGDVNGRKIGTLPYSWKRFWRSYAVNGENAWQTNYHIPWPAREETPMKLGVVPLHVFLISENHGIDGGTGPGNSGAYVEVSEMEGLQGHASAMHRDVGFLGVASTDNDNGGGNYGYPDGRVEFHMRSEFMNDTHVGTFNGGMNDPWKWL